MIRRIIRSLRLTLPQLWVILLALLAVGFCEGLYVWLWQRLGDLTTVKEAEQILKIRDTIVALLARYGAFRILAFHPLWQPKYRAWLEQAPWTRRKPLPLGPVHWMWNDAVVVGVLLLLVCKSQYGPIWVLAGLLVCYLAALCYSFWHTGPWWAGYIIAFGFGLAARFAWSPYFALGVLAALYAVAIFGLDRAFAGFPWPASVTEPFDKRFNASANRQQKSLLGWPYDGLLVESPRVRVCRRDAILAPLLAAWLIYAVATNFPDAESQQGMPIFMFWVTLLASSFARVVIYMAGYYPPISLWGRFAMGRWWVPGYDRVLLAPFCTLVVGLAGWVTAVAIGPHHYTITFPIATALPLLVALNMGPTLDHWRLTGHHRIASLTRFADQIRL